MTPPSAPRATPAQRAQAARRVAEQFGFKDEPLAMALAGIVYTAARAADHASLAAKDVSAEARRHTWGVAGPIGGVMTKLEGAESLAARSAAAAADAAEEAAALLSACRTAAEETAAAAASAKAKNKEAPAP